MRRSRTGGNAGVTRALACPWYATVGRATCTRKSSACGREIAAETCLTPKASVSAKNARMPAAGLASLGAHKRRRGSWHARHSDGKQPLDRSKGWNSKDRAVKDGQEEGACVTCRDGRKVVSAVTAAASGGVAIRLRARARGAKVCTMSPASAKAGMRLRSGSSYGGNRRSAQAGRRTTPRCPSSGRFTYL